MLDGVLVVTVDGDFTPAELARKASAALDGVQVTDALRVLLDVSGATGPGAGDVVQMGRVFLEHRVHVPRIAVLGTVRDTDLGGTEVRGFHRRAEAVAWLGET